MKQPSPYSGEYLSCGFVRYDNSLPEFQQRDEKGEMSLRSYKVPKCFDVKQILNHLYITMEVKKAIIDPQRDNHDATDHLCLALELPEDRARSKYMLLDNRVKLENVFNNLYYLFDEE